MLNNRTSASPHSLRLHRLLTRLTGLAVFVWLSFFLLSTSARAQAALYNIYLPIILQGQPGCPQEAAQWLCLLNQYRAEVDLQPVREQTSMSSALALHTNYMLLNANQSNFHLEIAGNPGYTSEGAAAGSASNMAKGSPSFSMLETMELWMGVPNHRYHMLNPNLASSGFNLSCSPSVCFSGLNVLAGITSFQDTYHVTYPGQGQTLVPDEIFPVTWGVYRAYVAGLEDDDEIRLVSAVIYNEQNQAIAITTSEPNHSDGVYEYRNQLVLLPVQRLASQHTYLVVIEARYLNQTIQRSWSFTTR
jgi:hypothetical protein